ncbi:glycoside hydrolase family 88 protein [Paenibacillus roseipurpureus]|uniref:Glycoside hydrolase family 88 protein n=1 Tax=Paenibacillus roseopurpureus TaxID=2918901 RepID=A0AA96RH17_9BACL|nr:glycoside hydrolase family 88 protein [Paenibacillus sp. MBLB1832]WNR42813.1 glycoside hydrolase family 88 protein [Paenibacillus sp. MBLB1832]
MSTYATLHAEGNQDSVIPVGKRLPLGWKALPIGGVAKDCVRLSLGRAVMKQPAWLRVTVALDVREAVRIEVLSAVSETVLGELDIRYASVFQPFQLWLSAAQAERLSYEGVLLRLRQGSSPIWVFIEGPSEAPLLLPHLRAEAVGEERMDPWEVMPQFLATLSSLQPFGWLEGCVLDGLLDLERSRGGGRFREAAEAHLRMFFDEQGSLHYENPRSEPVDGAVYGIEGTLPFAALAQLYPQHPAIEQAIAFWLSEASEDGTIRDGTMLSAEGSYTIAYPMAIMAKLYHRQDLVRLAIQQLKIRKELLFHGNDLYLRYHEDGSRSFRNWSRAYAWYMLGLARTLRELRKFRELTKLPKEMHPASVSDLEQELARIAQIAINHQSEQGLWYVFVDEPHTRIETSGSAAIAAALAIGVELGILSGNALDASLRARQALSAYFTTDGILQGVAQNNKGGEELQRGGYRIMSQMATGLAAQLDSALQRAMNKTSQQEPLPEP